MKYNHRAAPNQSDTTAQPNLIKNMVSPSVKALNKNTGKRTSSIIEKGNLLIFYTIIHDNRQKILPCSVFTHLMFRTYHKYCSNKNVHWKPEPNLNDSDFSTGKFQPIKNKQLSGRWSAAFKESLTLNCLQRICNALKFVLKINIFMWPVWLKILKPVAS